MASTYSLSLTSIGAFSWDLVWEEASIDCSGYKKVSLDIGMTCTSQKNINNIRLHDWINENLGIISNIE
jgi:hypothetical protein